MKLNIHTYQDPKTKQPKYLYTFTKTREFVSGKEIDEEFVLEAFDFAYGMSFGNEGHHRSKRSGGKNRRKNGEKFADTFQGKLAEFAFWQELTANSITLTQPDTNKETVGIWDTVDFEYNGYKIAIKSTKSYGHLLLLETADWDNEGLYIPNKNSGNEKYDFFVLIRIKPFIESSLKENKLLYSNDVTKEKLSEIFLKDKFEYDIPGFITRENLKTLIKRQYIIPQGVYLNQFGKKNKMDAENYYIQSGSLRKLSEFYKQIKN